MNISKFCSRTGIWNINSDIPIDRKIFQQFLNKNIAIPIEKTKRLTPKGYPCRGCSNFWFGSASCRPGAPNLCTTSGTRRSSRWYTSSFFFFGKNLDSQLSRQRIGLCF